MIDFLKAYPNVTRDEYMWEWTIPQIQLALYDNTHIVCLPDRKRQRKGRKGGGKVIGKKAYSSPMDLLSDFKLPVIDKK